MARRLPKLDWAAAAMALCCALPLLARLYVLHIPVVLNVDEAQWTVSARRILDDPIVWRANDLTTSGPLNILLISWPFLFGGIPQILTSRLTGLLAQSLTLLICALIVPRGAPRTPAWGGLAATAIFLACSANPDYIHYSSETLSLLLMAGFGLVWAGMPRQGAGGWRLILGGLIATSLPLAKLQSAPFCLLFHALGASRLMLDLGRRRAGWGQVALYAAASALPVALFIAPLFLVGEQQAVLTGYLGLGAHYKGARSLALFWQISPLILLMMLLLGLALRQVPRAARAGTLRWDLLTLALGKWPCVFLCIWLPGRLFEHYNLYAIFGLPLSVALACAALGQLPLNTPRTVLASTTLAGIFAALTVLVLWPYRLPLMQQAAQAREFAPARGNAQARALFDWMGLGPRDSLLMWGWEPELTAYGQLRPGDRASHGEYLIRPNPGRDYFRARLLRDMAHARPTLVVDTMRPDYFFTNAPGLDPQAAALRSFPALFDIVQADYSQVGNRADCAGVYFLRARADALRASEIALSSDAAALVDGSITEKCHDWWAPAAGAPAVATLAPVRPEPIGTLWILSSRGGAAHDRGSTAVAVELQLADGTQRMLHARLVEYPYWTVLDTAGVGPVAKIVIRTEGFVGAGAALNEVKAFRAEGRK